jgi:hypothetical protein
MHWKILQQKNVSDFPAAAQKIASPDENLSIKSALDFFMCLSLVRVHAGARP